MSSREQILSNLHRALQENRFQDSKVNHIDLMKYNRDDLLHTYIEYQKANMANVILTSKESISNEVLNILKSEEIDNLLVSRNALDMLDCDAISSDCAINIYDKSVDDMRERLFNMPASILHARVGVANLGILGLSMGSDNPRLASLVTTTCIVLLKKSDIVANLFSAFEILKRSGKDESLPSNIVFMAGPSRTADIELKTVFGVHGPQKAHVILY